MPSHLRKGFQTKKKEQGNESLIHRIYLDKKNKLHIENLESINTQDYFAERIGDPEYEIGPGGRIYF